jgi:hypothetical protein
VTDLDRDLPKSAAALLAALARAERAEGAPPRASRCETDAALLVAADLAQHTDKGLVITAAGRAHVLRHAGADDPFRAQHLSLARRLVATPDGCAELTVDDGESPLAWLARRKGRDGRPLIEAVQWQAGERLRGDFTRAHLTPRVTSSWDASAARGRRGANAGAASFADTVVAARERVRRALDAVGPEFAGLLLDVCCFLKGLEDVERERRWPPRSAKVVVQLGLDRLARHYGLAHEARGPSHVPIRAWRDQARLDPNSG